MLGFLFGFPKSCFALRPRFAQLHDRSVTREGAVRLQFPFELRWVWGRLLFQALTGNIQLSRPRGATADFCSSHVVIADFRGSHVVIALGA